MGSRPRSRCTRRAAASGRPAAEDHHASPRRGRAGARRRPSAGRRASPAQARARRPGSSGTGSPRSRTSPRREGRLCESSGKRYQCAGQPWSSASRVRTPGDTRSGMARPFLLFQLSDPHIGATWADGDPVAGLAAAVESVRRLPDDPDAGLMSGDLADNAADGEYELVRELLVQLSAPVYVLPGNHDDRDTLRRHFDLPGAMGTPVQYAVDLGPLRLVVVDSTRPGEDRGELDALASVIALRAVHGVVGLVQYVDARRLRPLVVAVDILDRDVDPALAAVAAVRVLGALGFDQDDPLAMRERGMVDLVLASAVEDTRLEAECVRKPLERRSGVAIGEGGIHVHGSLLLSVRLVPTRPPARGGRLRRGR